MKEHVREEPAVLAAAERQMHTWALDTDLKDRAIQSVLGERSTRRTIEFVAISREAGTGGPEIGQCLGKRLGWKVFDKNLLDYVAERFHLPRSMLDLVDETRGNWAYDVLGAWLDRKIVPSEKYFADLYRAVRSLVRLGHAVFVGRGVQFLLPRDRVFAVRLVAPTKYRLQRFMVSTGMTDHNEALRRMNELDEGRRRFVERFLHRDIADPHYYDLVVNVERCPKDKAVAAILAAMRS